MTKVQWDLFFDSQCRKSPIEIQIRPTLFKSQTISKSEYGCLHNEEWKLFIVKDSLLN